MQATISTLKSAHYYIEKLGWSVIPIKPGEKTPKINSWMEFQNRLMTPDEIDQYFSDGDNIGIICGKISNLLVVDVDNYKKSSGLEISSPLEARTPRGGRHVFFRYSEGGNTVNHNLAVDIRGEGGYVVAAPSRVNIGGAEGEYKWYKFPTADLELPLPPQTTVQEIRQSPASLPMGDLMSVSEGGRNDSIHKLALSFLARMSEAEAWTNLLAVNNGYNPPLPESEVRQAFESAVRRFTVSPPVSQKEPVENATYKRTNISEDILAAIDIYKEGRGTGLPTGYAELDKLTGGLLPSQSYLLFADSNVGKSVLAVNILMNLAKQGVKTTYFDLENPFDLTLERLLLAAADGKLTVSEWREIRDHGSKEDMLKLFAQYKQLRNVEVLDLTKFNSRWGEIRWEYAMKEISERIPEGTKVFIVDHLHYFAPGETDHAVLGEIARQMNNIAAVEGIVLIVIAHTKKGLQTVARDGEIINRRPTIEDINGSAMVGKHFKNVISLRRNINADFDEDKRLTDVEVIKTKYGPTGRFQLVFNENTLNFKPAWEPPTGGEPPASEEPGQPQDDLGKIQLVFPGAELVS